MKSFPTCFVVFLGSMLLACFAVQAQSAIPINANDNVTTTIFFPSNIAKVVPPAVNFNFEYEDHTQIGLLKGRKGKPSNLLVITEDGYAYSFALSYSEEIQKFNFILTIDQAVSQTNPGKTVGASDVADRKTEENDSPEITDNTSAPVDTDTSDATQANEADTSSSTATDNKPTAQVNMDNTSMDTLVQQNKDVPKQASGNNSRENEDDDLYDTDREEYYRIFCENNYLQKTILKRSFRKNKKIALRLNNILTDRNEKYFILQIENNSKKEFSVGGLGFFRRTGVGQLEKIITPLYSFNLQETIDPQSVNEVVYVFKNFEIGNKETVSIVLTDASSDNGVVLPMDNLIVNSPSN
ncbi:DUF4138 domain-containing protein [Aggregatimonas sangjinii]|uniref:DUF4138 domain-containing protein n=1 Tax=Aggregatimonas sangjinii TaxID=2583587 RepID=A0A5B7SN97_9FLAO|nr:DUF4138 domain-containing protein [Aggregatimonas sangjinii]QCX00036.1 DUF4138 domain-containing protein [Aggregatimonas sangjinii]